MYCRKSHCLFISIDSLMKCTLPSANVKKHPPACRLRGDDCVLTLPPIQQPILFANTAFCPPSESTMRLQSSKLSAAVAPEFGPVASSFACAQMLLAPGAPIAQTPR